MPEKAFHISELIEKHLRGELSAPGQLELDAWLRTSEVNRELLKKLEDEKWVSGELQKFDKYDEAGKLEILRSYLPGGRKSAKIRSLVKRIAVAASIILAIGIVYFVFPAKKKVQTIALTQEQRFKNDVPPPEANRAMITLADGRTISIDSLTTLTQNNVRVVKTADGKIMYQTDVSGKPADVVFNTLSNPRGSKVIDITLADGSRVWLNAGSSLTYPVAFVGNDRRVNIIGEAYFEVKHDNRPFFVGKGDMSVQVLGTHFNVNTYEDEKDIKVTLLEGSVKVSKGTANGILKPGQQAQLSNDVRIVNGVDVDAVMAWKNGYFQSDNATVESVMRQISYWYDVQVVYQQPITKRVSLLNVPRTVSMQNLLKIMEMTGNVKFMIEGKKVTVLP